MTKQAAVQRAYQWATAVVANPKSGCVLGLCARQVAKAVETSGRYEDAYEALQSLVEDEWKPREKREAVAQAIKIVAPMLALERSVAP